MLKIKPTTLKFAQDYIKKYHRHNIPPVGCKFAICICDSDRVCGVAVCGRPVSRFLDDGETLEIYRCCTDGTKNACSCLYGACRRIAKSMGYKKVITYTLQSESGTSLKASNFINDGIAGGKEWTGTRKKDYYISPKEKKIRWHIDL